MLIIDFYTLQTIYTLNFLKHVILNCTNTFDFQDIVWIYATFGKFITSLKESTVCDLDSGTVRNKVCFCLTCFRACNDDLTFLLCIFDISNTGKLCDNGKSFRFSCLKKLLNTRKTLCNIITCNTTGVECTHRKLCTRLTD